MQRRGQTQGQDLRPSGPLVVAIALAAVAGFVDAHLFLNVAEVFVANMSGNVVLFGMALGRADWDRAAGPGFAMVAFVVGMAAATWLHQRTWERHRHLRPERVLAVEVLLLLALTGAVARLPDGAAGADLNVLIVLILGGLAMGVQTAVLRRVGSVAVATTYESGAIARLGEESILAAGSTHPWARTETVRVLGVVIGAYVGGAAAGAACGSSPAWLLVPTGVAAAVGVLLLIRR